MKKIESIKISSCTICTIRLEEICYQRAWWFRAFREILATGIRLYSLVLGISSNQHTARSKMCNRCLRFRKNILKERSPLFCRLDSYLNPVFNYARNSLLTPQELDDARVLAKRAADRDFNP